MRTVTLVLALALLALRLPSLVQPMGADQSLYAYVGERIRGGGLPYRDAWDQKPPAIHFLYAGLRTVWPGDAAVPAADLAAVAIVALLLYRLGNALGPAGTGAAASLLFLLLSNPAFTRVGGVRLRSQCETFIAVAVAAAFVLVLQKKKRALGVVLAGVLCGVAFALKYNAAIFAVAVVAALWLRRSLTTTDLFRMLAGFAVPALAIPLVFALGGALRPLVDATIVYNLQYSGETYRTPIDIARYLVTFPIERARFSLEPEQCVTACVLMHPGKEFHRNALGSDAVDGLDNTGVRRHGDVANRFVTPEKQRQT